jgi:hypothetical protein
MKKLFVSLFAVTILAAGAFAEKTAGSATRFYGKIVSVDQAQRSLTVHNAKQKADATFRWDDKTGMTSNKKPIPASELKVGQSLIVSYVAQDDVNHAMKITVRTPFRKNAANP